MKNIPMNKVDYYDTFPAFLTGISQKFGDRPCISYFSRKQERSAFSYREVVEQAFALGEMLCVHGLAGKHIAIVGENSYSWLIAYLAAAAVGSVAVCIDIEQSDETIREMIRKADASAVFASETYLPICRPFIEMQTAVRFLFQMGGRVQDDRQMTLQILCEEGKRRIQNGENRRGEVVVTPNQVASIVYTSGTTSLSKPVMLTQKNILQNTSDSILYISAEQDVFSALPFYHAYGMTCAILGTLVRGAHVCINGDLKTMMRDMMLAQPDSLITVPLMVEAIHNQIWLNAEKAGKAEGLKKLLKMNIAVRKLGIPWRSKTLSNLKQKIMGNLHIIVSGGAHLSVAIAEEFEALGILILQGYGITECSPLIATNCNYSYKMGTVGHVIPSLQIKFVDEEIWVKGPSVMKGYYKEPEMTAEVLKDGWFNTGDIGAMDKNGFLSITGRKKNLIVFKNGKKVAPEKIEELIREIPLVRDVLVYGAESGASADDVKLSASIYPDPQRAEGMSSYEILEHLQAAVDEINETLPSYQQIQMITIRETEFTKTSSKKIKRHLV